MSSSFTITAIIRAVDQASRKLQVIGSEADRLGNRFRNLGQMASTAGGVIAGMFAFQALSAFQSFVTEGIKGAVEQEESINLLRRGIKALGEDWTTVSDSLIAKIKEVDQESRFSFNEIAKSAVGLANKTLLSSDKIIAALPIIADTAVATGLRFEEASSRIGDAIEGNTRGLKEFGVAGNDLAKALEGVEDRGQRLTITLDLLRERYGGAAQEDLSSYAGRWAQINQRWEEAGKLLGTALLPTIEGTTDALTMSMEGWLRMPELLRRSGEGWVTLGGIIGGFFADLLGLTEKARVQVISDWRGMFEDMEAWQTSFTQASIDGFDMWGGDVSRTVEEVAFEIEGTLRRSAELQGEILQGTIDDIEEAVRRAAELQAILAWEREQLYGGVLAPPAPLPPPPPGGPTGGWFEGMQHGGLVTKPTLALLGEAGPELVTPLGQGRSMGGELIINFYVSDDDLTERRAREFSEWIARELRRVR